MLALDVSVRPSRKRGDKKTARHFMRKFIAPVFILLWIMAAAVAYCLPAAASVSTTQHATLIKKVLSCKTTVEGKDSLFIVVDTGRRFTVKINGTVYVSPDLTTKTGNETVGYIGNDHYRKDSDSYTVTTNKIDVTLSHCEFIA